MLPARPKGSSGGLKAELMRLARSYEVLSDSRKRVPRTARWRGSAEQGARRSGLSLRPGHS
jgi:hypothetical protein